MKVIYAGIFFDEETYKKLKAQSLTGILDKSIPNPHVTLEFKPKELLPNEMIGKEVEVTIVGEGNDGMNHGYKVKLTDDVKQYYKGSKIVHITMSINYPAKPADTKDIKFENRSTFNVKGKIGYFTDKGVVLK